MEPTKHTDRAALIRKEKYPPSTHHFPFSANGKEYLFFTRANSGFLIMVKEGKSELLRQIEMPNITPLHFLSTGHGDIHILHSEGLLTQFVEQLAMNIPFVRIDFQAKLKPKKMVKTEDGVYIIIGQENKLFFMKEGTIYKEMAYPSQMMMETLMLDSERIQAFQPRLIIPHRKDMFPFIFSGMEVMKWQKQQYLQQIAQLCQSYYLEDQILPQHTLICFTSAYSKIYICLAQQIFVLSIRYHQIEGIDYLASPLIKVKTRWTQPPLFTSASNKNGALVLVTKECFSEVDPTRPKNGKAFKVKQKLKVKDDQTIKYGYALNNGNWVFISNDPVFTRLYIL